MGGKGRGRQGPKARGRISLRMDIKLFIDYKARGHCSKYGLSDYV